MLKNMLIIFILTLLAGSAAAEIKPLGGKYKCVGVASVSINLTGPFVSTNPAEKTFRIKAKAFVDKLTSEFDVAIMTSGLQNVISGRILSNDFFFKADAGTVSVQELLNGVTPNQYYYENIANRRAACGCRVDPLISTSVNGSRINHETKSKRFRITIKQDWLNLNSSANEVDVYSLLCKK